MQLNASNLETYKYIALDKNLKEIADITAYVDTGTIEYNALSRLKASCSLSLQLEINKKISLKGVRIYHILNGSEACLGTFIISTPASSFKGAMQTLEAVGYSTLYRIAHNAPSNRYYVPKGTNAINEVKRVLNELGFSFSITESVKTTSTNREWEIGANYLDIINDLLDVANFTPLYVDELGTYISEPYVLPQDRAITLTLDEDVDYIEETQANELDLFNVPNKFIRYCSNEPTVSLYAVFENTDGEVGTDNTWVNTSVEEVKDVADYDTLYAICKRDCARALSIYNKVQIATPIMFIKGYLPIIELKHYQAKGRYECTSFKISLETGGTQEMSLRKVVEII